MSFRRWAAGLIGSLSQWLQDRLWPPYTDRYARGGEIKPRTRDDAVLAWMESRGWNN